MSEDKHIHEKAAAATAIADGGKFNSADDWKVPASRYVFNRAWAVITTKTGDEHARHALPLAT